MNRVFASLALALCVATGFAQTPKPPATPEVPKITAPSDSQKKDVQLAIKDFQISQLQAQTAQTAVQDAQRKVMATVEQLKKELKLDDTWDFDYNSLHFVKRPEPAKETKVPEKK